MSHRKCGERHLGRTGNSRVVNRVEVSNAPVLSPLPLNGISALLELHTLRLPSNYLATCPSFRSPSRVPASPHASLPSPVPVSRAATLVPPELSSQSFPN